MKNIAPNRPSPDPPIKNGPLIEKDGLLFYRAEAKTPEVLNASLMTLVFGEPVVVDHFVLLFSNLNSLNAYTQELIKVGAEIIEGPGKWPQEFCPDQSNFPDDLSMQFISARLPSVILVLAAPHAPNDQIDRLLQERGINAVHHIAIRVHDMDIAANLWRKKGFIPLSVTPQNDGCLEQWLLRNSAGQIIELICRHSEEETTFSCKNIAALRLSEENPALASE